MQNKNKNRNANPVKIKTEKLSIDNARTVDRRQAYTRRIR